MNSDFDPSNPFDTDPGADDLALVLVVLTAANLAKMQVLAKDKLFNRIRRLKGDKVCACQDCPVLGLVLAGKRKCELGTVWSACNRAPDDGLF